MGADWVIAKDQRIGKVPVGAFRHFKDVTTNLWNMQTLALRPSNRIRASKHPMTVIIPLASVIPFHAAKIRETWLLVCFGCEGRIIS